MQLVRLMVRETDVPSLQRAFGFALAAWTRELRAANPTSWERFAVESHTMNNMLAKTPTVDGQRRLVLLGDVAGALHAMASTCERVNEPTIQRLAPLLRSYADAVVPLYESGEAH